MSALDALLGAQLRRIDAPFPDTLALSLHRRELDGVLLLGLAREARGVGWLEARPHGRVETPLLLRLKHCLEGGQLTTVEQPSPAQLALGFERAGERFRLVAIFAGVHGNAVLRAADDRALAALRPEPTADARPPRPRSTLSLVLPADFDALRSAGEALRLAATERELSQRRARLLRALRAAHDRLERRLGAVEGDRARAAQTNQLRQHAALLLAHLHALPRDCTHAELLDYTQDPPAKVALDVDPRLGPQRQAQAWFERARKLERGATLALERAHKTRTELAAVAALAQRVADANDAAALERLELEARACGVQLAPATPSGSRRAKQERLPYREFRGSGGRSILVGRGPDDNDRLTLDHARPSDLWLHVRDTSGAHVVVPLARDEACPPELLGDAATLAAHFSQARGQSAVDVIYTPRRYVRKPRKAAPGLVSCMREKVFRLELQPIRLKRLLESELPR